MKKNHYRFLTILLAIFFLSQTMALAQAGRGVGRLGGVVLDNNDKPVVGARLVLTYVQDAGGGLKLEATTNKKGEWSFIGLGSGRWSLMVSAEGFAPATQEVTVSQLEKNPRITIKLQKASGGVSIIQDQASLEAPGPGQRIFQGRQIRYGPGHVRAVL